MDDLISRQDAINELVRWGKIPDYNDGEKNVIGCVIGMLSALPSAQPEITETQVKEYCEKRCLVVLTFDAFYRLKSAQPERKKGQWGYYDGMCSCSVCNSHMDDISPFCPMCGADMRG